jgi:hypothetical protein
MEGGPEVSTVDRGVTGGFGVVQVLAARAVQFNGGGIGGVVLTGGEEGLACTEDARAFAEFALFKFVELLFYISVCCKERLGKSSPFFVNLAL